MKSYEIQNYVNVRNHELNSDEILFATDVSKHPQIDHIVYENGKYEVWDNEGYYWWFTKRNW